MDTPHADSLGAYIEQGLAVEYTTSATLDGKTIYFDDMAREGDRIELRADFDNPDSAVLGIFVLGRNGRDWVLTRAR